MYVYGQQMTQTSLRYCIILEPQPFKIRTAHATQFLVSFRVLKEE